MYDKLGSCGVPANPKEASRVGVALDTLCGRVHHLEKLAEELIDLIQYPQPAPCNPDGVLGANEPTLHQQINRIDSRVDDVTQRLTLAVDIIRQNLDGIKLD